MRAVVPNFCIIGSSGFVGSALNRELGREGLVAISYSCSRFSRDVQYSTRGPVVDSGALVGPLKMVDSLIRLKDATTIVHLASSGTLRDEAPSKQDVYETVDPVLRLQDACPDSRVIFLSSSQVYGKPTEYPIDELFPLNPENHYAEFKIQCEERLQAAGQSLVVLRPFNLLGLRRDGRGVMWKILNSLTSETQIFVRGNSCSEYPIDWLDLDAVSRVVLGLSCVAEPPNVLNVGSGRSVTPSELFDAVHQWNNKGREEPLCVSERMQMGSGSTFLLDQTVPDARRGTLGEGIEKLIKQSELRNLGTASGAGETL